MITGVALLASGYRQFACQMSSYHWQMTVYLVWFSSFTHLATLTVLRRYFKENPSMRWWRVGIMGVIVIANVAALVPTGHDMWLFDESYTAMPALCMLTHLRGAHSSTPFSVMIISTLILVTSYTTRVIKLFQTSSDRARLYLREMPSKRARKYLDQLHYAKRNVEKRKWATSIPYWFLLMVSVSIRALLDVLASMFWEVGWALLFEILSYIR